jgi:hypothetical protein
VDIWEALKCQRPLTPNYGIDGFPIDEETQQLQRYKYSFKFPFRLSRSRSRHRSNSRTRN